MFIKKGGGGLFSILVQNSPKVTKKVQKGARSCCLTKKLLKILKVAKKLSSRIWKGLAGGGAGGARASPEIFKLELNSAKKVEFFY